MSEPLIIQYANLLHKFRNPAAPQIKEFLRKHQDPKFVKRARTLNRFFKLKQDLVPHDR